MKSFQVLSMLYDLVPTEKVKHPGLSVSILTGWLSQTSSMRRVKQDNYQGLKTFCCHGSRVEVTGDQRERPEMLL